MPRIDPLCLHDRTDDDGCPGETEADRCRHMYAAMMIRAIRDAQGRYTNIDYVKPARREALYWIETVEHEILGFDWVCSQIDMNPFQMRRALWEMGLQIPEPIEAPKAA